MRTYALAALVTVAAIVSGGCDGGIYARGRVVDLEGRPLAGTRIVLEHRGGDGFARATDAKGCFAAGGVTAPGRYFYLLRAEIPGYKVVTGKVATLRQNYLMIVLAPADAGGAASTISPLVVNPCVRGHRHSGPQPPGRF